MSAITTEEQLVEAIVARIVDTATKHNLRCATRVAREALTQEEWLDVASDLFFGSVHAALDARHECSAAAQAAQYLALNELFLAGQCLGLARA